MAASGHLTIEDYEQLPDALALNHELVDGELVDVSGNSPLHNLLRGELLEILRAFVREHKLGIALAEQEYEFGNNAHGPDISFFTPAKRDSLNLYTRVQRFVPDLAIEIASPHDKFTPLLQKCDRYRASGVQETWLISIETRRICVARENDERILHESDTLTSPLLPGLSITLQQLLNRLP